MSALRITGIVTAAVALPALLSACEVGEKVSAQTGYRGTGMAQITDTSSVEAAAAIPAAAYALPADEGPLASATYKNVPALGGLSTARFDHLMAQITQWVAPPEQGCNYCHNPADLASDEKYTKVVARRMLEMTRTINTRWSSHVKDTGVTCYTCHRGNAVPEYSWAIAAGEPNPGSIRGNRNGQNAPDPNVAYASLPSNSYGTFLAGAVDSRVAGKTSYPAGTGKSLKETEASYGLMMHISGALGVNCTYCHNTQSLGAWPLSRTQRATAYFGIRMVREVNDEYISSLASVFPAYRKGPMGDPYKINCTTCHQGASKPLGGVSMLASNPHLKGPPMAVAQDVGGAPAAAATEAQLAAPAAVNQGATSISGPQGAAATPVPAEAPAANR